MKSWSVAVVGGSGAVGREVIKTLEQRNFPIRELTAFASERNAGREFTFRDKKNQFALLKSDTTFRDFDFVFFTAGSKVSEAHVPRAVEAGAIAIDNSSLYRMNADVPLIVPEVNSKALPKKSGGVLVANPNCTTAQLVMALKPLHDAFGLKRVTVSSYQAMSGKGQKGIDEFLAKPREEYSCIPQIDVFKDEGFTGEEKKVMEETRKILGLPRLKVVATCVRVPVMNCHSISASVEFEGNGSLQAAAEALAKMPGVRVALSPEDFPLAPQVSGTDDVYVARLRVDPSSETFGLVLWIVADNLRKGAALNAVQIAEAVCRDR